MLLEAWEFRTSASERSRRRMTWGLCAFTLVVIGLLAPSIVRAACGCVNNVIQSDGRGPCLEENVSWLGPSATIRWRFQGTSGRACWQFADGSWGVEDGITITAIEPEHSAACVGPKMGSGCVNGWVVNPASGKANYFDGRIGYSLASLGNSLPFKPAAGDSIVKAKSLADVEGSGGNRVWVEMYSVLTVLDSKPANAGNGTTPGDPFRPPFWSNSYRPIHRKSQVDLELLPDLPPVSGALSKQEAMMRSEPTKYTIGSTWYAGFLYAKSGGPGYAPTYDSNRAKAYLYTATQNTDQDKMDVAVGLIQEGIDLHAGLRAGLGWRADAGIYNGRFLPIVYAGGLLNASEILNDLEKKAGTPHSFQEWSHFWPNHSGSTYLYGRNTCEEGRYWDCVGDTGRKCSSKDCADPYGYIDGGKTPGSSYQRVTYGPYSYTVLMYYLVPALRDHFHNTGIVTYIDRLRSKGIAAGDDPCAGPGAGAYRSNWGPDGKGGCIKGSPSRYPGLGGRMSAGSSARTNAVGENMWAAYRSCMADCSCSGMVGLCDGSSGRPEAPVDLEPPGPPILRE
jgi:hypothetical protein